MAIEVIQHGTKWINDKDESLACPECGSRQKTKKLSTVAEITSVRVVTFTCERCGCVYKLEKEIT